MVVEPDKKINHKAWKKELDGLKERYQKAERPLSDTIVNLAKKEVLNHNKRDFERMLQNERSKRSREIRRNSTQTFKNILLMQRHGYQNDDRAFLFGEEILWRIVKKDITPEDPLSLLSANAVRGCYEFQGRRYEYVGKSAKGSKRGHFRG